MAKHIKVGQKGEGIALDYLLSQNHIILETNWRFEKYEIDIISKINDMVVFTEVKTRTSNAFGKTEDAITKSKQSYLAKAADEYIYQKQHTGDIRFDIISIEFKKSKEEEI